MKKPKTETTACGGQTGHNSSSLQRALTAKLRIKSGEPRTYSSGDIETAIGVLRQLSPEVPLPVVINDAGEVLVGGLLVLAAQNLGIETLLLIQHDGFSDLEQKRYALALSQLLTKGTWDPTSMESWIRELEDQLEDFSHASIGFEAGELDHVLSTGSLDHELDTADAVPAVADIAVTQRGQKWLAGKHEILCGSATEFEDVEHVMGGRKADMAMTDQPYGCGIDGFVSKKGLHRDFVEGANMGFAELEKFTAAYVRALHGVLRQGALAYLFIDWRSMSVLLNVGERVFGPLAQMCCWVKNRPGMGSFYRSQYELVLIFKVPGGKHTNNVKLGVHGRNRSNVWPYPSAASSRSGREGDMLKQHPTPKGVEMIGDAMLDCTNRGDRVIDCFLGSGTSLIAAERTGRICHGIELDPLYVDVAIRRWQVWTGLEAVDAETGQTFNEIAEASAVQGEEDDHE